MNGRRWLTLLAGGIVAAGASRADLPLREVTVDDLVYEEYIEPFVVNPPSLLRNAQPFLAPPPLFEPFDPFDGLDPQAKTSRVALPGDRAVAYMPVLNAKVGDTIEVPMRIESGPPIRACRLVMDYDPDVLKALDVTHPEWKDIIFDYNTKPDPEAPRQIRVFVIAAATEPWTGRVPFTLRFQVVGSGESVLRAQAFEYTDAAFDMHPAVFRNGLVRASP